MGKRIGVMLSGCGVLDGTEIHEAVITLLSLDRAGAEAVCMAPNASQMHVVNHLSEEAVSGEERNILVESARIARGDIRDVKEVSASDIDGLIFPGGFGAAKNLCTFAVDGENCRANPDVTRLLKEMHAAGKPIGAICISPVLIAKVFGEEGVSPRLTIGTDQDTASKIREMKGEHINCTVSEFVLDEKNRFVTTPAYMLGTRISEVASGIEKLVDQILKMA